MAKKKKKVKHQKMDLYYMNKGQAVKDEEAEAEKKRKEREKRIRENKEKENNDEIDLEMETAIQMTNRNKLKKEEERRKIQNKEAIKRKKRNKKIKFFLKLIISIGLIVGGTIFALTSPIFNIKEIKIVNNNLVPSDTIISLSGLKYEENIFKFLSIKVVENVKSESYIENVKVHRKFPNIVEIEVEEREPKYCIKLLESYAYINTQGYILEINTQTKEMPVIQGFETSEEEIIPGQRLGTEDLHKLEDVIKITNSADKHNLSGKVTTIDISEKNEYSIYIAEEKKTIHLGDSTSLNDKMRNAVKIMENEKNIEGEIFVNGDINNGFQPYFREKV